MMTWFQETCLGLYDLSDAGLYGQGWQIFCLTKPVVVAGDYW